MQTADEIREAAKAAEREGRAADALGYVDMGIVAYPNRADLHALRARLLLAANSDLVAAANHAVRAAQLEPGNANYRDMAQEYCKRAGIPVPVIAPASGQSERAAPPQAAPPQAAAPSKKRSSGGGFALPATAKEWTIASLAIAAVVAIVGWNVYALVIAPAAGHPRAMNVAQASQFVPLSRLQLMGNTAYGTVTPAWAGLPDREKKVVALAAALGPNGVTTVVLSDAENHLVARGTPADATVFVVAAATARPAPSSAAAAPSAESSSATPVSSPK